MCLNDRTSTVLDFAKIDPTSRPSSDSSALRLSFLTLFQAGAPQPSLLYSQLEFSALPSRGEALGQRLLLVSWLVSAPSPSILVLA